MHLFLLNPSQENASMTLHVVKVHSLLATKVKCTLGVFTTIRFIENHSFQHLCQGPLGTFRRVSTVWQLQLMLMIGHGSGTPSRRHPIMSWNWTPFRRLSNKWGTKRWRKFLLVEICCLHWVRMSNIQDQFPIQKPKQKSQIGRGRYQSWMKDFNQSRRKKRDPQQPTHQTTRRCRSLI